MRTGRLEAFSDGVLAIIITIMVLEMKVPERGGFGALKGVAPVFLSYLLSFLYIGIYWNNHHHLFQASERVNASVLWANLHLLFWLSLVPFVTGWMGRNDFGPAPVALYGMILLMAALAYFILVKALLRLHGEDSALARALGSDTKGKVSLLLYLVALPTAFRIPWLAGTIYAFIAILWLVPDRRIAARLQVECDETA